MEGDDESTYIHFCQRRSSEYQNLIFVEKDKIKVVNKIFTTLSVFFTGILLVFSINKYPIMLRDVAPYYGPIIFSVIAISYLICYLTKQVIYNSVHLLATQRDYYILKIHDYYRKSRGEL